MTSLDIHGLINKRHTVRNSVQCDFIFYANIIEGIYIECQVQPMKSIVAHIRIVQSKTEFTYTKIGVFLHKNREYLQKHRVYLLYLHCSFPTGQIYGVYVHKHIPYNHNNILNRELHWQSLLIDTVDSVSASVTLRKKGINTGRTTLST